MSEELREIKVEELVRGAVIKEGRKRIPVLKVERLPERCPYHVHINDSLCYDTGSLVTVE